MTLKLYDKETSHALLEREYPKTYAVGEGNIIENTLQFDASFGKGFYREIFFDHVHIGYGNMALSNQMRLHFESDFETVEMHFALKGKNTVTSENFKNKVTFESYQHNIIYANQMYGRMEVETSDIQMLEINLSPDFFKRFLPEDSPLFETFKNAIYKKKSGLIHNENSRISLEMYTILNHIINCERKGIFKRIYMEAKIIELLLLQLEQLLENSLVKSSLVNKDKDKIYAVRDFIIDNLNKNHSLIDLAHHVGTNEFTLKKGFRELFGTTVFGFWNDLKMEYAKKMLVSGDMNISEVSDSIGYKNPRHFSAAFKRKYGLVPSQFKK